MTVVFPILLGGLLLTAIPVLLHLIMRRKPKTLPFPAFRFLVQRQRTNLRKLRVRHLLLLLLRVLLIAAVCLGLARPRLFHQGLNLSSDRPVAAVLVFDTSLSMELRTSDKVSRLDEAKKRGLEFLNELPDGSRVVILDSADSAGSARGDWLVSQSQARERIKALKLRPAAVSVLNSLEYAYRLLGELARSKEDETRRYLPRFVCVFSDRTRACWDPSKLAAAQTAADQVASSLEGLQEARANIPPLVDLLKELRGKIPPPPGRDYPDQYLIDGLDQLKPLIPTLTKADFPPDAKLCALAENIQKRGRDLVELLEPRAEEKDTDEYRPKLRKTLQSVLRALAGAQGLFVAVGLDQPVDLAITQLELPKMASGQPRQLFGEDEKLVLRAVVQASGKDLSNTVVCKLDKKTLRQAVFRQAVEVKAGEKQTVPFELDCQELGPGPHQVEVRLETVDLLPFNNQRYATFAVRAPRRILVVSEDKTGAADFSDALRALGFVVQIKTPREAVDTDPLPYLAIYLFAVPAPAPGLWDYLGTCVRQGIGLGIVPAGDDMKIDAYNHPSAQKLLPGILSPPVKQGKDDGKNPGALWDLGQDSIFQHPLMAPFRHWKDDNNIDLIRDPSGAFTIWEVKPHAREAAIVNYNLGKRPALLERRFEPEKGRPGNVLLFTTPLDVRKPRWNNYLETKTSFYIVLVGLATNYLAGETEALQLNFILGQSEPVVLLPPALRFPNYTLRGPDFLEPITAPDLHNDFKLKKIEAPGNYVLEAVTGDPGAGKRVAAFSVNVPGEESDLTRVPPKEIEALFGPGSLVPIDRKAGIRDALGPHWSEPLELFPLLMVVLLIVLALENLLANKFYKRDNDTPESG